jgi:putative phage-type endonuclease
MNENIIQGSQEWIERRLGRVTASRVADVLATIKTGESASRKNYRMELVCQRLTGQREEGFTNSHMERGIELEPLARAAYEFKQGVTVTEVGFVDHPSIEMSGASPDGLVGLDGLVEIKCPTAANHVETLLSGKAPTKYIAQMQWQMACTGAKWCDFVSYCPLVGENLALFVVRVERDEEYIAETEKAVQLFLTEVSDLTTKLKELK